MSVGVALLVGLGIYFLINSKKHIPSQELNFVGTDSKESIDICSENIRSDFENVLDQFDELELTQRIYQLLVVEEIYLQQGLTVGEFAKKLGVQARIVTEILNKLYGHSFKELTNMYRVEYAKEKIEEGFLDLYTVEALGNEAGFSSRTTFFNVFKREIGVCPSEFWKNYLAEAA
ncbi:AraC family transcriptional regulator [Algoriphagus sp. A40]|uniref:helix-turn-helix domain-containing protein n=1 Tax=Algoriphagus sp. A40 TaxID=1945863 RepID=UPI001439A3C8|nr:helix-turn-helix domain-containing protein [Algoriphagus sp. A40]